MRYLLQFMHSNLLIICTLTAGIHLGVEAPVALAGEGGAGVRGGGTGDLRLLSLTQKSGKNSFRALPGFSFSQDQEPIAVGERLR